MDRHKIHRICVELIATVTELAEACEIVDLSAHKKITDQLKEICAEVAAEPKTNGDRIRQMSDEELVDVLRCKCCAFHGLPPCEAIDCKKGHMIWLKQEAKAENNKAN